MRIPRFAGAFIVVLSVVSFTSGAVQSASCSFSTFSPPEGYTLSAVEGINDDGTVVGQVTNNTTQVSSGFVLTEGGSYTMYSAPQSWITWLYGQNASAVSAGTYLDTTSAHKVHGFLLSGTTFSAVNYPKATNTWLFNVNQLGDVVGSYGSTSAIKGFLLANGKYTTIAYQSLPTYPLALNSKNAVVGYYVNGWVDYGFLWESGKLTEIDFPNAMYGSQLTGINDSGVMVGNYFPGENSFAFIYENGLFKKIKYPGALSTVVAGINNNGVISGQMSPTPTTSVGFTAVCK